MRQGDCVQGSAAAILQVGPVPVQQPQLGFAQLPVSCLQLQLCLFCLKPFICQTQVLSVQARQLSLLCLLSCRQQM